MHPPAIPRHPISFAVPCTIQSQATRATSNKSNYYETLAQKGSGESVKYIDKLTFGSISRARTPTLGSRGSKGRDPTPMTPEVLYFLDRLEPDKGNQARLITEDLNGQRTLPTMEAEM
jgi:hypothetical protein